MPEIAESDLVDTSGKILDEKDLVTKGTAAATPPEPGLEQKIGQAALRTAKTIGSPFVVPTTPARIREQIQERGPVTPTELLMDAVMMGANLVVPGEAWWAPAARVAMGAGAGAAGAAIERKPIFPGAQAGAIPMIAGEAFAPISTAVIGGPAAARVATKAAQEATEAQNLAGTKAAEKTLAQRAETGEKLGDIADKQRRIESAARSKVIEQQQAADIAGQQAALKARAERATTGEELGDIANKQRRIEATAREQATATVAKTATQQAEEQVKEQSIKELHDIFGLTPEQIETMRAEPDFRAFRQRVDGVKDAFFKGVRSLKEQLGAELNRILPDNSLKADASSLAQSIPGLRAEMVGKPQPSPAAVKLLDQIEGLAPAEEAPLGEEVGIGGLSIRGAGRAPRGVGGVGAIEITPQQLRQLQESGFKEPSPPTTIGNLKTLRTRASALLESGNATDRLLGQRTTDAIDNTMSETAGLTPQQKADLGEARRDYKMFHDTFGHDLAGAVSHSTNPAEVADHIFGNLKNPTKTEEQIALQLVDQLKKNDPQRLPALKAALGEKIIRENLSPDDFRKMNRNVLKSIFGPSDYARIEPWFNTKVQIERFENQIKASPEMQRLWQREAVNNAQTETYHNLENKARELAAKLDAAKTPEEAEAIARSAFGGPPAPVRGTPEYQALVQKARELQAQMPAMTPQEAEAAARAALPDPNKAAVDAIREWKRGALHQRAHNFVSRYGVIFGLLQPARAAKVAAMYALTLGPREAFRYALTRETVANAFWRHIQGGPNEISVRAVARIAAQIASLKAIHEYNKPTSAAPVSPPAPGTPTPAPAP